MSGWHPTAWAWRERDPDGYVLREGLWRPNTIVVDGLIMAMQAFFQAVQPSGNFSVGLCSNGLGSLTAAATLGTLTELAGNGYARQSLTRDAAHWPTFTAVDTVTERIEGSAVTFTASGAGFSGVTHAFLIINNNGAVTKLVCFASMGGTLAVAAGNSLDVYPRAQVAGV